MEGETFHLVAAGINYRTSTISEREPFQINKEEIKSSLLRFKSSDSVGGVVIVSTCGMLEFYFSVKPGADVFSILNEFYSFKINIMSAVNEDHFYLYCGANAAEHLFGIAAGLDPALIGENRRLNQIKEAYAEACSVNAADRILHKLFHSAFRVGKTVCSGTGTASPDKSLSETIVEIVNDRIRKEDVITIVGVNQNTKSVAGRLSDAGFNHLIFVNRTLHKAEELACKYDGIAFGLDYIEEPLISSKCLISCTGSPGYVISSGIINKNYLKTMFPKLIIDIAVPRDVDTAGLTGEIEVIDVDGLKKYSERERKGTAARLRAAEKIISEEAKVFESCIEEITNEEYSEFDEKMETVRMQLLNETRLTVSENELHLLDKFSHSLIHRMKSEIAHFIKMNNL